MVTAGAELSTRVDPRTAIVQILGNAQEVSLSELLDRLKDKGLEDQVEIKAVIWRLISEGEIDLSSKRNLLIHREKQAEPQGQNQSQAAKTAGAS